MYRRLDAQLIAELEGIVGAEHVHADDEMLGLYAHDETEELRYPPEVVVQPESTAQVQELLRLAHTERVPVTPCGARTGLSGGSLCLFGGIALSIERMQRIKEIDTANFAAVVEPGVITQVLQEAVEAQGLFYPPDPSSRGSCTIAGNIAENAGGPRAVKYGVTEDWVRGIEAVLAGGEVIRHGGKLLKDVTGYNLVKLLCGSEGTLAVVTEATLRLIAKPGYRRTMLVPFPTIEQAIGTVPAAFHAGLAPAAIEFMERAALEAGDAHTHRSTARGEAEAYLLIELDGDDEAKLDRDYERLGELCLEEGAEDVWIAHGETQQEELWNVRRAVGEAVKAISTYREEDTVVPRARLPEALAAVREVTRAHGVRAICYGHAGDGNIHVNVLKMGMDAATWSARIPEVSRDLFRRIIALGGTITGEHGIGCIQKGNLPLALGEASILLHRRLKEAFDPRYVLNPGKIFDR